MATGIARDLNQSLMLVASYSGLARQALIEDPPNLTELENLLTTTTQAALDGGETVQRLLLFAQGWPEQASTRVDRHGIGAARRGDRPSRLQRPRVAGSLAYARTTMDNAGAVGVTRAWLSWQ